MPRRRAWLVPLLLLGCVHAPAADDAWSRPPVGARLRGCGAHEVRVPEFFTDDVRLGPGPGALPYTADGRVSAYTLRHLR